MLRARCVLSSPFSPRPFRFPPYPRRQQRSSLLLIFLLLLLLSGSATRQARCCSKPSSRRWSSGSIGRSSLIVFSPLVFLFFTRPSSHLVLLKPTHNEPCLSVDRFLFLTNFIYPTLSPLSSTFASRRLPSESTIVELVCISSGRCRQILGEERRSMASYRLHMFFYKISSHLAAPSFDASSGRRGIV